MTFSKITEDSLGSQKMIARDGVPNKMVPHFPETYSWLEEVENDNGTTW